MAEAVDTLFQDAVEALRHNDRARAKDILTRLIKSDPNNATYWIWMSASVDTLKERVYCLETALKLDPENGTIKRGLLLLGARRPDQNVQPFSLNRPRDWEDKLFLANEQPRQTGLLAVFSSPATRLVAVVLGGAAVIGLIVVFFANPGTSIFRGGPFRLARPSPTHRATPTLLNAVGGAATPGKPTPLAVVLGISYTATPLYVNTPRPPASADLYRIAQDALKRGSTDLYLRQMEQLRKAEPEAADIPYQIGEYYRLAGDCAKALFYFNESLKVDNSFAPGYLGLARARLCMEPGADITKLYAAALQNDSAYGEAYLDRANFFLVRKDYKSALPDLDQAARLLPGSPLVQLAYAQAYLMQGSNARALQAAKRANATDLTLLPSYFYLGRAYITNGLYAPAIQPLKTYLVYEPEDASAFALLGEAFAETGDYRSAVAALNTGLRLDSSQTSSFIYLGISYLRSENMAGAEVNFKRAIEFFPDSFDANIGLTEIFYKKGTFGSAYLQSETAKSKATGNKELALALYWRALSQEGRGHPAEAIQDWRTLLAMPPTSMTQQMRKDAQEHLRTITVPTKTPTGPTPTPSVTPTNRPGSTATPPPGSEPAPTNTP